MNNKIFNKRKRYHYKTRTKTNNNKSNYRKLFIQTFFCILIVVAIIIIKLFNVESGQNAIKVVKYYLENDRNIKSDTILVMEKIKDKEVFNNIFEKESSDYVFPVSGSLYRGYGMYKKSNNVEVFNKGIDIVANEDSVKAIADGVIKEMGKDNIYGKFIIIEHDEYSAKYYGFDIINKKINQKVKKGEKIGTIKNNNERLDFRIEVYKDDEVIDPLENLEFTDEDILLI